MHDPIPPTVTEHGTEKHPAWVLVGVSRVTTSPPGAVLFDSDIRHQHSIVVRVQEAERSRNLHRDWLSARKPVLEFQMSEAQWASFVSSVNVGDGVPATLRLRPENRDVPGVEYEPRLRESMNEVRTAADDAFAEVKAAFEAYEQKKNAANLRNLKYAIQNAPSNIAFVSKSLGEHAENVVQRARADVEAMVVAKAEQLNLDPAELGGTKLLGDGS
jgi:hypothetical protein